MNLIFINNKFSIMVLILFLCNFSGTLTLTKIKDSFAILKNLVLEAKSEQNSNFESANSVTDSRDISKIGRAHV